MSTETDIQKKPSFLASLLCIAALLVLMLFVILVVGGQAHIALIIAFAIAGIVLWRQGFTWDEIMSYIAYGGRVAMSPCLIIMSIGLLVGAWIAAGTVPMIIYYGLLLISPSAFLATAFLVCCITSITSGSSWSTGATMGVALMGVGFGLDINPAMTAGAIVSGSYFGDKMSPISDTTILSASAAGADVFDHIKSMAFTTIPALVISLILYIIIGMRFTVDAVDQETIQTILYGIETHFQMNPILLIPPLVILVMAIKKMPSIPTILVSTATACIIAIIFQGENLTSLAHALYDGYVLQSGIPEIDRLLSRGGLMSKMFTVALALIAIAYGGVLEKSGMLEVILKRATSLLRSVGSLIATTVASVIFLGFTTASQYLTIVLGNRIFVNEYKKKDLLPQVLSRTVEDSGTMTSALIPWNSCGLFFIATLGVAPWVYVPYAFLNWITPLIALIYGFTGKFVWKTGEIPSKRTYREEI